MTNRLLQRIGERHPLTELKIGEMATLKASGMKFSVRAFRAEGLGHVSVMRAKGFFGLMKMDTLIVNPTVRDLPLYSYDRVFAMGNDTLIVELYDTALSAPDLQALDAVKADCKDLPERDPGVHWYDSIKLACSISKKGKKEHTARFDALAERHFDAYLAVADNGVADVGAKQERAAAYVNGLLSNGGPSTDVFKKALGEETTAKLFREVLFGTP